MVAAACKPSSTQYGAVAESIVAAQIILSSNGRLMPFKPIADDNGIDLLAYDKECGTAWPLQIKSRTKTLNGSKNTAHFDVRKATFNRYPNAALLAVLLDVTGHSACIRCAWLLPMTTLPELANSKLKTYTIRPSISAQSGDKYVGYRCESMRDVCRRLTGEVG